MVFQVVANRVLSLCRAAALALMGWYLVVPIPQMNLATGEPIPNTVATEMPLKYGDIEESFDSAKDCKAAQRALWESHRTETYHHPHSYRYLADAASQCIASDDPRLAK
jgi:hypothetical protein